MKTNCGIYKIENTCNRKVYIGSSSNLKSRKYAHLNLLKKKVHPNNHLQNSYNKNGKENFKFVCIYYIEKIEDKKELKEELLKWEQYYIQDCKDKDIELYNIREKAESNLGIKLPKRTLEYRGNIRARRLGKKHSEETKEKISISGIGKKHSEETKEKISITCKNHEVLLDTRIKISTTKRKNKSVILKDSIGAISDSHYKRKVLNITTGEIFSSIKEASIAYAISQSSIGSVCREERKISCGCEWKFVEQSLKG